MGAASLVLVVGVAFVVGTIAYSYAAGKGRAVGAVVAWKGSVYVKHVGDEKGARVKSLEGLYAGDIIMTVKRSRAKILLKDDSIISMGPESKLKIDSYTMNLRQRKRVSRLRMLAGKVRAVVTRKFHGKGSFFRISTPSAIVGVKGTDFIISSTKDGDEIVAISGKVTVGSSKKGVRGEVVLKGGHGTRVKTGKAPSAPEKVPSKRMMELIDDTEIPVTVPIEQVGLGCVGCHEEAYASILSKKFGHTIATKSCNKCHIKDAAVKNVKKYTSTTLAKEGLMFLDLLEKASYSLTMRVKDVKGDESLPTSKRFVPSDVINDIRDDKRPPVISNLRVVNKKPGIFFTIELGWETDELSSTVIEYGAQKKSMIVQRSEDKIYKKTHRLSIDGLRPGKKFYFSAVAEDPHGNKAKSKPLKIKISKRKVLPTVVRPVPGKPVLKEVELIRVDDRLSVKWKADRPIKPEIVIGEAKVSKQVRLAEPHYPGFVEPWYRSVEVCMAEGCHQGSIHKKMSHPINVVVTPSVLRKALKKGLTLIDGKLTCATCHDSHGGNVVFMLRREESKICTICHKEG